VGIDIHSTHRLDQPVLFYFGGELFAQMGFPEEALRAGKVS
jgi:hypothetical protein